MSGTNVHFEGVTRLKGVDAALSEDGLMEEGMAGPIGKLYEAEAFLGVVPLHDCLDRGACG
jgi:hypothetical protein